MRAIRLLAPDVISRIAAGEVIERPASVLKELLENALDAGASKITVESLGAGRKLLRVADDGRGIPAAECETAFERHATSKIVRFKDIDSLSTFGFRGEALFSIAAVAKVTLTSRAKGGKKAWRVDVHGGRSKGGREAPPAEGTVIEVRDLFFNTPARAKFLKSDSSEKSHLARVIEEAALANPAASFVYISEGREHLRFSASRGASKEKALRERVGEVLGTGSGKELLLASGESAGLTVTAYLSPEGELRRTRSSQYCFVNRRPVTSRTVQQALYRAYDPFRPRDRHPAAVIYLDIASDRVDVNVHPNKREIRFRKDAAVFESVTRALSKALLGSKGIPTGGAFASFRGQASPPSGTGHLRVSASPAAYADDPTLVGSSGAWAGRQGAGAPQALEGDPWFADVPRFLGQIERSYLLFEEKGGLVIMDQHAAQERILFEKYLGQVEKGDIPVQDLMLPVSVEMPASAVQKLMAKKKRLVRAGFKIDPFGKTAVHVRSVPALFSRESDVRDTVQRLIDGLLSPGSAAADARYDATATIACKASVKAHDPLSAPEAMRLLSDLRACLDPSCCPHGRPTLVALDRDELARKFKRSGAPPL